MSELLWKQRRLNWTDERARRASGRRHLGHRIGEHPRYEIRREWRSGATTFIVRYLGIDPLRPTEIAGSDRLAEAKGFAEADCVRRVALGELPPLEEA